MGKFKRALTNLVVNCHIAAKGKTNLVFPGRNAQADIRAPEDYGLDGFEETSIASDGVQLGIWHKPPESPSKPVYVVFHGQGGHWGSAALAEELPFPPGTKDELYRIKWLKAMADSGAGVVAVHPRGFGKSADSSIRRITQKHILSDMEAVDDFLQEQGIAPEHTIVAGESLGGAMAAILSETMCERGHPPHMLGLINSFSAFSTIAHETITDTTLGKRFSLNQASPRNTRKRFGDGLDTASRLDRLHQGVKLYIAHAPDDDRIPLSHAETLRSKAESTGLQTIFRELSDEYRTAYTRTHVNWNPGRLVADMEAAYRRDFGQDMRADTQHIR